MSVPRRCTPDGVQRTIEAAGGQLVYRSVETSPIKISKRRHPANTNPLLFGHIPRSEALPAQLSRWIRA